MEEEKYKLKLYDYIVIGLVSDLSAGVILAILSGNIVAIQLIPLLFIGWVSYENFRLWMEKINDQR